MSKRIVNETNGDDHYENDEEAEQKKMTFGLSLFVWARSVPKV